MRDFLMFQQGRCYLKKKTTIKYFSHDVTIFVYFPVAV